jgi:trans-2,3-dihydro-3-hydroxyanthranilate isomerase
MPAARPHRLIRVFAAANAGIGGNPAPVWLDADDLSTDDMQALAHASGHESAFVLRPSDGASRLRMRYFVPAHEMEMCGHATVAALWLLRELGEWDGAPTSVQTASGIVQGRFVHGMVEISQPRATVRPVDKSLRHDIARCLRLDAEQIDGPVLNAATSRVKTLIRLPSLAAVHALRVDLPAVESLCGRLGSTGLYPFALASVDKDRPTASARQFPKSSGYPEDPATGIAATALAWGLRAARVCGDSRSLLTVHQGEAMGSPSAIFVRLPAADEEDQTCWLRGDAHEMEVDHGNS